MSPEEMLAELEKRGIQISVGGCGCCGSPMVKIFIDGELVFDEDDASMASPGVD